MDVAPDRDFQSKVIVLDEPMAANGIEEGGRVLELILRARSISADSVLLTKAAFGCRHASGTGGG